MELGFEKIFLMQNIGGCLRVSEAQAHSIYKQYVEACDVLQVPPPTSIFIQNDPYPNFYT